MVTAHAQRASGKHEGDAATSPASRGAKRRRVGSVDAKVNEEAPLAADNNEDEESAYSEEEIQNEDEESEDDDEGGNSTKPRSAKKSEIFVCCECGAARPYSLFLTKHGRETGHRPFACQYDGCANRYMKREHLTRHVTAVHELEHSAKEHTKKEKDARKRFQCELCQARFTYKHGLTRHTKLLHMAVDAPFKCATCLLTFKKKSALQAHSYVHTGVPPFECTDCGERFLKRYLLTRHERTHASETASQTQAIFCQVDADCVEIFFSVDERLEHERIVHSGEKTAEACEGDGVDCEEEEKKEEEKPALLCQICDRTFKRKQYMRAHLRTHFKSLDERKQFVCPIPGCGKSYTRGSNLMTHYNAVHDPHKSRRFVCPRAGCDARFGYKTVLTRHVERIHDNPQPPKWRERKSAGALERALGLNEVGDELVSSEDVSHDTGEKHTADVQREHAAKRKRIKVANQRVVVVDSVKQAKPVESSQTVASTKQADRESDEGSSEVKEAVTRRNDDVEAVEQPESSEAVEPREDAEPAGPDVRVDSMGPKETAEFAVEPTERREQSKLAASEQEDLAEKSEPVKSIPSKRDMELTKSTDAMEQVEQLEDVEPGEKGSLVESKGDNELVELHQRVEVENPLKTEASTTLTKRMELKEVAEQAVPTVLSVGFAVVDKEAQVALTEQPKQPEAAEPVGQVQAREKDERVKSTEESERVEMVEPGKHASAEESESLEPNLLDALLAPESSETGDVVEEAEQPGSTACTELSQAVETKTQTGEPDTIEKSERAQPAESGPSSCICQ